MVDLPAHLFWIYRENLDALAVCGLFGVLFEVGFEELVATCAVISDPTNAVLTLQLTRAGLSRVSTT